VLGRAFPISLLPFGSALDDEQLTQVRDAIRLALRFAGSRRPSRPPAERRCPRALDRHLR